MIQSPKVTLTPRLSKKKKCCVEEHHSTAHNYTESQETRFSKLLPLTPLDTKDPANAQEDCGAR